MRALTVAGRWWVAVLGLSVLCIVLALGFFNPNARRSDIEAWVSEQTGRRFTFAGELGWRVWPNLAVTLPRARLERAPWDSSPGDVITPFAEWQRASLSVRLWPLLRGRLEFGALQLNGLRLRLRRDASGRDNWQDVLLRFTQDPTPGRFKFKSLAQLQVRDAEVTFDEAAVNRVTTLRIESLRTTAVAFAQPIGMELQAQLVSRESSVEGPRTLDLPFTLSLRAELDAAAQHWRADDLQWSGHLTASGWPTQAIQALPVALRCRRVEWQSAQQLDVTLLQAAVGTAQLNSDQLQLTHLQDAPRLQTTLQFAVANLRQWLTSLGIATPATRDATVLQKLSARIEARGSLHDLQLQPLELQLDQTRVRGTAQVQLVAGRARYRAELRADQLNLDRYLPARGEKNQPAMPAPLPIEWLRDLQVQGRLHIDAAQWQALRAQQLTITLDEHEMNGA